MGIVFGDYRLPLCIFVIHQKIQTHISPNLEIYLNLLLMQEIRKMKTEKVQAFITFCILTANQQFITRILLRQDCCPQLCKDILVENLDIVSINFHLFKEKKF